uniref:uncharacterized protein LOC122605267 n=1 Tax=Erigeron canadensis TaxID=72917 RepID=UPI001CB9733E|nr:uncharacterized protein LOC122605267 [Erigeron canadensis]
MQVSKAGVGIGIGGCISAKLNDSSGGKKSKRRSKDERKSMVETFIKRHQASNNGSFPSLYLTHKEVGGSYYTVREIFRDLIQENRVLAPPKLPPGEHNMENLDSFLENYPLGSIAYDPNVHGLPPQDKQKLLDEYEFRREKILNTKRIVELHKRNLDIDIIINASARAIVNDDEVEPEHTELLMEQGLKGQKHEIKEVVTYQDQIRPISENVVVETFPLRPVSSAVDYIDEKTNDREVLKGNLELASGNDTTTLVDSSTEAVDTELEKDIVTPLPKSKAITDDFESTLLAEDNAASTPSSISSQHRDSNKSSSYFQLPSFDETTANKNFSDIPFSYTANEINFYSSESATSRKSDSEEANPILAYIKTFISTFMKFWPD